MSRDQFLEFDVTPVDAGSTGPSVALAVVATATLAPVAPPAPALSAFGGALVVDAAHATASATEADQLRSLGWQGTHGGEAFERGTRMAESGQERARAAAAAWEAMPLAGPELERFSRAIKAEGRHHGSGIPLRSLQVSDDGRTIAFGRLQANGSPDLERDPIVVGDPTAKGWQHLADRLVQHGARAPGLRSYLPECPARVRRIVAETHALQAPADALVSVGTRDRVADWRGGVAKRIDRSIYRVGGPRYLSIDPDVVADALASRVRKDWRVSIDYDGESWTIDALTERPYDFADPACVGDTHSFGVRFRGNDVREGRFTGKGYARRWRCLNGTELESTRRGVSRIHAGTLTREQVRAMIVDAIDDATNAIPHFVDAWTAARRERVIDAGGSPSEVFAGLIARGLIDLPGSAEDVTAALMRAWDREPGYSKADVVNAISRAAHEERAWWNDLDTSTAAEAQASALLYNVRAF